MTYGLQINGSDSGGDFIVADSDLNMVNYRVIMSGRAHTFQLPNGLKDGDFIFVKDPGGNNLGEGPDQYTPIEFTYFFGQSTRTDEIAEPYVFRSVISDSGVVKFYGDGFERITVDPYAQGGGDRFFYETFDVKFDYFVVRSVSDIESDNLFTDDTYGLRILTSTGETAFDSRSLITNEVFSIETVLEPSSNYTGRGVSSISYSSEAYVNIEWSGRQSGGGDLYGLTFGYGGSDYIDASEEEYQDESTTLWYYQNWDAIFAARLESGGLVGGGNTSSGTLSIVGSTNTTEPASISFDATTNTSGGYHVSLFQLTGNANDYTYNGVGFTGTSKRATFYSTDTNTSRTLTVESIINYSRQRPSDDSNSFTRNFIGNYTSSYLGDFTGDFASAIQYTGNYTGDFTGTRPSTRTIYYGATYEGNYIGEIDKSYSATTSYGRDYTRYRPATYEGNYNRNLSYEGNYTRYFISNRYVTLSYDRTSTRTRLEGFARDANYTRSRVSAYTRGRPEGFIGNFTRNFIGNYNRTLSFLGNFLGDYTRSPSYLGEYFRNNIRYSTRESGFTRTSTRTRVSSYGATREYAQNYVGNFTRDRIVNYTGNFARNFAGNYSRTFYYTRNFLGNFSGTTSYLGNYTRTSTRNFTRTLTYSRTASANPYQYSTSPRTYWEIFEFEGQDGETTEMTRVYWNGTQIDSFQYIRTGYVQVGTYFYHIGDLEDANYSTYGVEEFYSVARTTSSATPTAGGVGGDYTRTGNYARNYLGNYTRTRAAGASTRNFLGNFTRTLGYNRTRSSSYTRDFAGNFVGDYARDFIGNYIGAQTQTMTDRETGETFEFPLAYTRNFAGNYIGDYTGIRSFAGNYETNYNRTRVAGLNYQRTRTQYFTRTSIYNRTRIGYYTTTFSRDYTGNYLRYFTGDYAGIAIRIINTPDGPEAIGDYYVGDFTGDFIGDYNRSLTYIGNRGSAYERIRTKNSVYQRNRIQYFTGEYSRDYNRTLFYIGDFQRTSIRNRSLANASSKVSSYSGTGTFSRNFLGEYSLPTNSTRNSTLSSTRTSILTRVSSYTTTNTTYYTGEYIGNYTRNSTISTGTSEVGFQGERYVAQLRTGNSATDIAKPRGSIDVKLLAEVEFSAFDNDSGVVYTTTSRVVKSNATSHIVKFDFRTEGTATVSARIYRGSSIIVNSFNLSSGLNTITVPEVPSQGSTLMYQVKVFNGNEWITAGLYEVMKLLEIPATTTTTQNFTATTPTFTQTFTSNPTDPNTGIDQR